MSSKNNTSFLLIHGLGSKSDVMKPLEEVLAKKGYNVLNITLPGHNTVPEDMLKVSWQDWAGHCQTKLDLLLKDSSKTFVVGTSLGGILALYTAAKNSNLTGVITCSTAVKPHNFTSWFLANFRCIKYIVPWLKLERMAPKLVGEPKNWWMYKKIPMKSLGELSELLKKLKPILKNIEQPILIIHSEKDKLASIKGIEQITTSIGSKDQTIVRLNEGGHVIFLDECKQQALTAIENWLERRC